MKYRDYFDVGVKLAARFPVTPGLLMEAKRVGAASGKALPGLVRSMPWLGRTIEGEVAQAAKAPEGSWLWILRQLRKSLKATGRLPKELVTSAPKETLPAGVPKFPWETL